MLHRFRKFMFKSRLHMVIFCLLVSLVVDAMFIAMKWSRFSVTESVTNAGFTVLLGLSSISMKKFVEEGYRRQEARKAQRLAKEESGPSKLA